MKFIDKLLRMEEMNGDDLCPTYMRRWTLFSFHLTKKSGPWLSAYIHHFVGDDWSRDMHDHSKRFWSIGLWGSYIEERPSLLHPDEPHLRLYSAPWFRSFPPEHIHRVRLVDKKPCWTLVFVGRPKRAWGFWHDGLWIPWQRYVWSKLGREMKSCD